VQYTVGPHKAYKNLDNEEVREMRLFPTNGGPKLTLVVPEAEAGKFPERAMYDLTFVPVEKLSCCE